MTAVPWWAWALLLNAAGIAWVDHRLVGLTRALSRPACTCGCLTPPGRETSDERWNR